MWRQTDAAQGFGAYRVGALKEAMQLVLLVVAPLDITLQYAVSRFLHKTGCAHWVKSCSSVKQARVLKPDS